MLVNGLFFLKMIYNSNEVLLHIFFALKIS